MLSVIFTPLYLLQYFVVLVLSLQGLPMMGIILVVVSWLTTSGNYIALYISNRKIKHIAEKVHTVRVVRGGRVEEKDGTGLVPGDVVVVGVGEVCYDGVLVAGEVYADECSLTG